MRYPIAPRARITENAATPKDTVFA